MEGCVGTWMSMEVIVTIVSKLGTSHLLILGL